MWISYVNPVSGVKKTKQFGTPVLCWKCFNDDWLIESDSTFSTWSSTAKPFCPSTFTVHKMPAVETEPKHSGKTFNELSRWNQMCAELCVFYPRDDTKELYICMGDSLPPTGVLSDRKMSACQLQDSCPLLQEVVVTKQPQTRWPWAWLPSALLQTQGRNKTEAILQTLKIHLIHTHRTHAPFQSTACVNTLECSECCKEMTFRQAEFKRKPSLTFGTSEPLGQVVSF